MNSNTSSNTGSSQVQKPEVKPTTKASSRPQDRQYVGTRNQNFQSELDPFRDVAEYFSTYARQNPGRAAAICFGVGFILGWRLKPW